VKPIVVVNPDRIWVDGWASSREDKDQRAALAAMEPKTD
jgi:hypothetical protein